MNSAQGPGRCSSPAIVSRLGRVAPKLAFLSLATLSAIAWPATARASVVPLHAAHPEAALTSSGSNCPTGTVAGATSNTVNVAVTVVDITGSSLSNATVGVPSPSEQDADWSLVAKAINSSGGAGCRKIAVHFYNVNPLDAAAAEQVCLNIAASMPFIVLDTGALSDIGASNCIPGHKIPLASIYLTQDQLTKYYPYYLLLGDTPENATLNQTLGLKQLGYFSSSKGFKKLGLLYHDCTPALVAAQNAALQAANVPKNAITTFDLGCPAGQTDTPASIEESVLAFKNAGVTDVMEAGVNDFGVFTQVAAQQHFTPKYVLDDLTIATGVKTGADAPNPSNFNGAVNVIGAGYGEQTTPGYKPSGGTKKCNAIFAAAGQPTVYKQTDGYGGVACDYLWFVQSLLDHAKTMQQGKLATDMHAIGTLEASYSAGPIDFSAAPAGQPYGVSYWRPIYYHSSCACWQVPDPTFHPPFKSTTKS